MLIRISYVLSGFLICLAMLAGAPLYAGTAIFAGGCFWCMEKDFDALPGVSDVVSGFTGGELKNPSYNGNHDGHYEAIKVSYDADKITYQELLEYYWHRIDPFDAGGQFCDRGHSYQSAIFVANAKQKQLAENSKQKLQAQFKDSKVVTPILAAGTFYPIKGDESYHQDYYKKSPLKYKFYRWKCGRDQRLKEIWGKKP